MRLLPSELGRAGGHREAICLSCTLWAGLGTPFRPPGCPLPLSVSSYLLPPSLTKGCFEGERRTKSGKAHRAWGK